ncbi:MAG: glutaredoxin 3 [Pseudomonadota bacterium]
MAKVEIYTKDYCPFCHRAKALLAGKGVTFTDYDVTHDRAGFAEMVERSGGVTVPQVFVDGRLIGGSDDLAALEARGGLDPLLARSGAAA